MRAIVVEEKLKELFSLIPSRSFTDINDKEIQVKAPTYHFGDTKECNALLKSKNLNVYPLIFQTSTSETQSPKANSVTTDIVLVLATQNKKVQLLNTQRWETSYKNILMPLVEDVFKALNESGIILWNTEFTLDKQPNYSESTAKDANAFIDIVDAVIFRATITIFGNRCNNKTIFNH